MSDWQEAEQRVEKAHELYEGGNWEAALKELRAAIEINPNNSSWYFNLGLTLDMMERYEEALKAYTHALRMDPHDAEVLHAAGVDATRLGRYKCSIDLFKRLEHLDPTYEACYCNRIFAHAELGQHDQAEEMFYLARQYREKCPLCYYNMGHSLLARGLADRALWCWQQVLDLEPDYPQVHARIAEALWTKGQHSEARRHLLEELRCDPGNIDTLLDLGQLLAEMDQPEAAAEKFRQVLDLDPNECTAHFELGVLEDTAGEHQLALERFRHVLRHDGQFPRAHLRIAQIHQRLKNRVEALYHANCELSQPELDTHTLFELGTLLMDLNQLESARTAFARLLEMDPQDADARHSMAVILLMSGQIDEGIIQCKMALRIQPKYMLAMSNLALAYLEKRDFVRARYWLREAMSIAPDDHQLRKIRRRIRLEAVAGQLRHLPKKILLRLRRGSKLKGPASLPSAAAEPAPVVAPPSK